MDFSLPHPILILIEIGIGAILGGIMERLDRVIVSVAAIGFVLGIWSFLFANPDAITNFSMTTTELSEKITIVMIAFANFIVHVALFEVGGISANQLLHRRNSKF